MSYRTASEYWKARKEREQRHKALFGNRPQPRIVDIYCFCGKSNLWDRRCPACGKAPYTD